MAKGLTTRKSQRLVVLTAGLVTLGLATGLVLYALGSDSLSLFVQPSDIAEHDVKPGDRLKLGGLVATGSFHRGDDGVTNLFTVTDCVADVKVSFRGILPDLFREGQGVVTEGTFDTAGLFVADTVLAKHDENYAPPGTMPKNAAACMHPEGVATAAEMAGR